MTNPSRLTIRTCKDVEEAVEYFYHWPVKEQWDPGVDGLDVRQVHYPADPDAYFVGTLPAADDSSSSSKVVSIVGGVRHSDGTGFMAMYIVDPEHRGQGHGLAIFQHALQRLGDDYPIALDAVQEQVPAYRRSGFTVTTWNSQRYMGPAGGLAEYLLCSSDNTEEEGFEVKTLLSDLPERAFVDLDERCTGMRRDKFISLWVKYHSDDEGSARRYGAALVDKDSKEVVGFGCARQCVGTVRVAPLYAPSAAGARLLLKGIAASWLKNKPDTVLSVDVVLANEDAKKLFDGLLAKGWEKNFVLSRMWKTKDGQAPAFDAKCIYALTAPELG